jgi:hypothetical protein
VADESVRRSSFPDVLAFLLAPDYPGVGERQKNRGQTKTKAGSRIEAATARPGPLFAPDVFAFLLAAAGGPDYPGVGERQKNRGQKKRKQEADRGSHRRPEGKKRGERKGDREQNVPFFLPPLFSSPVSLPSSPRGGTPF